MNWAIQFSILLLLLYSVAAATDNNIDDDQNEPIRIDPILRKALLKALSTLERESEEEKKASSTIEPQISTTSEPPTTKSSNEILDESTPEDLTNIRLTSFSVVQPDDFTTNDNGEEIIKTVVISTPQVTLVAPNKDSVAVNFGAADNEFNINSIRDDDSVKIENIQLARSVTTSFNANALSIEEKTEVPESTVFTKKSEVLSTVPTTSAMTSTTTTTTLPPSTTPRNTTNEDGENIEKVLKDEVHIFQAPLALAFTVQQDEMGMPTNIVSLLRSNVPKPAQDLVAPQQNNNVPVFTQSQSSSIVPSVASQISQPSFFEQRQRELEQQIFQLQEQNRQQELLLRQQQQQQQYQDQQQRQNQALVEQQRLRLEDEARLKRLEQEKAQQEQKLRQQQQLQQQFQQQQYQQQQFQFQQQQFQQQQQQALQQQQFQQQPAIPFSQLLPPINNNVNGNTNYKFVPSLELPSYTTTLSVQQEPPTKDAVNFLGTRTSGVEQIQKIPLQLLPPNKPFQTFNPTPSQNTNTFQSSLLLPQNIPDISIQRNRVFRQDQQQTGNVAFIPSSSFGPFSTSQARNQLQSLLFHSGISPGRSQEEINIISKVLALNHGIPNSNLIDDQSSRRFVRHAFPSNSNYYSNNYSL